MKYLTIIPNYTGPCLKDDFAGQIDFKELDLPSEYINELSSWHDKYRRIIPLSEDERTQRIKEIEQLDNEGLKLAKRLRDLVRGGAKVKYYSEGRLKYLHVD